MKTVKIKAYMSTRFIGSVIESEINVCIPEGATKEEIENLKENTTIEWIQKNIDWGYGDIPESENKSN